MKRIILTVCALALATSVRAQSIPIHGSSQKAAYNSPSEWPFISAQQHWSKANTMPPGDSSSLLNPSIGHVHVECNAPIWGELTFAVVLPCQVQLFHINGGLAFLKGNTEYYPDPDIIWDDTGTLDLPGGFLAGDPMGIKKYTFKFTLHADTWRGHGWVQSVFTYRLYIVGGVSPTILDGQVTFPFYNIADPALPENDVTCDGCGARLRSALFPRAVPGDTGDWGSGIVEVKDVLPILGPLSTVVETNFAGYNYGNVSMANANLCRVDIDLHNGREGRPCTFGRYDPVEIGAGIHKVAMLWKQDTNAGSSQFTASESLLALLVVSVNVPDGTPLPPVNCVVGAWENLSTTVTASPVVTSGNIQTRTLTTGVQQQRPILTQPANGGAACPIS